MPHLIQLKDGSLLTPFDIRDLLDAVEQCAGRELRQEIESYINLNVEDIDDYEKEYDRMEKELDMARDHQRQVLCNIMEEVDALDILLHDDRLNRRRMQEILTAGQIVQTKPTSAPVVSGSTGGNSAGGTDYVANKNTRKVHYPDCSSVKQMKESNKLYFNGTREELIKKGYDPCKKCNP